MRKEILTITLGLPDAAGETSCCKICFLSTALFFDGVELLRFFRGDGVPAGSTKKLFLSLPFIPHLNTKT